MPYRLVGRAEEQIDASLIGGARHGNIDTAAHFDQMQRIRRRLDNVGPIRSVVQMTDMPGNSVIAALRAHESERKAAGVVRLSLLGSLARDAVGPESDIDLLAAFHEARPLSLLDVIRIETQIIDFLGRPVDLIEKGILKLRGRQTVDREAVRAF